MTTQRAARMRRAWVALGLAALVGWAAAQGAAPGAAQAAASGASGSSTAAPAPAGAPPSYAVMTLLADRLTLVTAMPAVGTQLDSNRREDVPLPDDTLEAVAAFAADDALRQAVPGVVTSLFTTRDAQVLALQARAMDDGPLPPALLAPLRTLVEKSGAQRLLVVGRSRGDARIRMADGFTGSGQLAGIGFYIDREDRTRNLASGALASGYVAPYAYVKVSVIDLATLQPLGTARAVATDVITYEGAPAAKTAWVGMNGAARFDALKAVIRRAVAEAVPAALR